MANIDAVLQEYLTKSESDLAVIIDKGGNVISQSGDHEVMDVTIIAALAAGSFAATKELARRIGEVEFNALYHQGNGSHIFMNSVDDDTIMITVFAKTRRWLGAAFSRRAPATASRRCLRGLREKPNTNDFRFDAADIVASAMSERR